MEGHVPDEEARRELLQEILVQVRMLTGEVDEMNHVIAARLHVSRTGLRALDLLQRSGSLTAGQLAERLRLTTGATTAVIDGLVASGHADRANDPNDRRRTLVRVTERSRQAEREAFAGMRETMRTRMGAYRSDELRIVAGFLAALREELVAHAERIRDQRDGAVGPTGTAPGDASV